MKRSRKQTSRRVDLGLAILSCMLKPGERLTLQDIAAWCDCRPSAILKIERRAMRKARKYLDSHPW
jgi:hypothetical protein